ncbi:MAG: hypothetical protein EB832_05385 [Thaumarchaeota archaeon S14]|nr:MAG: hypothetical protein EB832_05385 [Thaumarchaeota archaeon S14]
MDGVTERRARQEAAADQDAGRGGTAHADQLYGEILGILNISGRTAAELDAELDRKVAIHAKARDAVTELVPLAERDASRREELFGAIRKAVALSAPLGNLDAELVVLMVTVLLDAGRPVELSEVLRRIRERWGGRTTESALYSAKSSGAIRADMYGVLYLQRPIGDGEGMGEGWMYDAMERAVELGAARYTDNGIEMTGAAAALTERELAAAEAVARGITEYGAPPGLPEWLAREDHGDARRVTWAEATVYAQAARAEVGAAWADIAKRRGLERPAAAVWDWEPPEEDPLDAGLPLYDMGDRGRAIAGALDAVTDLARLVARGAARRDELLGAVREAVTLLRPAGSGDAEAAALMVAVLLDAGGPVEENEVYRRVRERWGRSAGRSALQAAMSCRAIRVDGYGVLYLAHDMDHDEGMGEYWMYNAMERAVELGAARYTENGIEMTGAAAALTERELAAAEAVARGINSYAPPPGLVERLEKSRGSRRVTWAEATVAAQAAEAEVGAAWAQVAKERSMDPAAGRGF